MAAAVLLVLVGVSLLSRAPDGSGTAASPSVPAGAPDATCEPSSIGETTARPVEPGPTSLGVPTLPLGEIPRGRYAWGAVLLSIDAPCWEHLQPVAAGTLLLSRTDVPTDVLAVTTAREAIDDPCLEGALVEPTVEAVEAWLRSRAERPAGEATELQVSGHPGRRLPITATADGACPLPRGSSEDALFGLPMISDWTAGGAADAILVDGPFPDGVTIIDVASSTPEALEAFRPLADEVIRSLDLLTAIP